MSQKLKELVPALISLVKQLSEEKLSLAQQLTTALAKPADTTEADAAKARAKQLEEQNKSLTAQVESLKEQINQEDLEDTDLAGQIQPYLKSEDDSSSTKVLETPPPDDTEAKQLK